MGIILDISSDLMENYKRFRVASTGKKMQAVCREGFRGFLSIGDDGILYLSYEKNASTSGWRQIKLCESLRRKLTGTVEVNTFSAAVDRKTNKDYILAALKVNGKDRLFLSVNGDIADPDWTEVPLTEEMGSKLSVYRVAVSCYNDKVYLIVDFKMANQNTERYFICSNGAAFDKWDYFPLPADFSEITDSVPGRAGGEYVDGVYTIGSLLEKRQLLYTPSYNYFDPSILPTSTRLLLPREVDSISTLAAEDNKYTHLFACGEGCLFLYPYNRQEDMSEPVLIAESKLFSSVKQIFSYASNGRVYVWILNENKELLYLYGNSEYLDQQDKWSDVFLMRKDIDYVYPFKQGLDKGDNALFAYTSGGEGMLGEESEITGLWHFTAVYLDSDVESPVAMNTYTTLIRVMDENRNPLAGQPLVIETKERCQVYINGGVYCFKGHAMTVDSNESGEVKIIQMASSAQAIQFDVQVENNEKQAVNPSKEVTSKLFELNSADKLKNAQIRSQTGDVSQLVPADVRSSDLEAVAQTIASLDKVGTQVAGEQWRYRGILEAPYSDFTGIHIHFGQEETVCREFRQMSSNVGEKMPYNPILTENELNAIRSTNYSAGDVLGFLRSIWDDIFDVVIGFIDNAWRFIVKIGEKVVSFIISCAEEVVACAVEIFQFIKVTVEKIIDFLKFIFDMDDVIRSRDVLKKLFLVSMNDMKKELVDCRKSLDDVIDKFIRYIDAWGEIGDIGEIGSQDVNHIKNETPYSQAKDVRSGHLQDMLVENQNMSIQALCKSKVQIPDEVQSNINGLIQFLEEQAEADKEVIEHLKERIQAAFMTESGITGMDVQIILKKLAAIIANTSLEIIKVIIDTVFELVSILIDMLLEALTKELYIPCVSEFLELCGIKDFSLLDVVCLVPAFMGTVIYKLITQKQLIDDDSYQVVMNITSLSDLGQHTDNDYLCVNPPEHEKLYFSIKLLGGMAAFSESIITAINYAKPGPAKGGLLTNISLGCNIVDGVCYMGSSYMYSPLSDKVDILCYSKLFSVFKYSAYLAKGLGFIQSEKQVEFDLLFKTMFGIASVIVAGVDIVFLIEAAKQPDGLEKKVFIIDTVSLLIDNLRNFGDFLLIVVEEPISHTVILAVRTVCAAGYAAMQIAEGSIILKEKSLLPEPA